ncbi:type IX secretion system lipoprotein PorK/GldK [Polaribacter pacificus]
MKNLVLVALMSTILYSCGSNDRGELTGVSTKAKWYAEKPLGMVLIPEGAVSVEVKDPIDNSVKVQTKSVSAFYMDETEITNRQYKQFIEWVKDSVVRSKLAEQAEIAELLSDNPNPSKNRRGIYRYAYLKKKESKKRKLSVYDQYMYENYYFLDDLEEAKELNWNVPIIWNPQSFPDVDYVEVMDSLYLRKEQTEKGIRRFDPSKLNYRYKTRDDQKKTIEKVLNIYPDTAVWVKDFTDSRNEPMRKNYFSHPAFLDYPVVGVTWEQAIAFCNWRTRYKNQFLEESTKSKRFNIAPFRLPTEAEWELAAKGGKDVTVKYSWGTNSLVTDKGCFLANFKPKEGNYTEDRGLYTVLAKHYAPNDYGLYNMSGNVAEWTSSSYNLVKDVNVSSVNPFKNDKSTSSKITKGGSWKDVDYFLEIGSRDFENKDTPRSYIGFRTVRDYIKN